MTDAPQTDLSEETTAAPAAVVPDKAALEGLEAKWSAQWKADGTYALRPHADRARRSTRSTLPRRPSRARCTSATCSPTPTPTWSPATSGCAARRSSTRWAGTTTACRPSAGCRTTTACAATRRCPTTPTSPRPRSPTPSGRCRSAGPTSSSCASSSSRRTSRSSRTLWRTLGLSVDWSQHYTTIGPKAQTVSQRAFLRNFARGEAYLQEAPTLWDVTFQTAVAQAELEAREYAGAYHRVAFHGPTATRPHRDHPPRADPGVVALIAHPDDERYQPLFGTTVTSPVFGVEIPVLAHPAAEPDKGAGIAMCCTFGDLTDVTWWRELQLPVRTLIGRDGRMSARDPGVARRASRPRSGVRGPRGQDHLQRPRGDGRQAARERRPRGRADPDPADGELLREGRQAARDRRHPPVVHHQRRPRRRAARRDARARREIELDPGPHEAPLRQLGRRPQRRLADLAPAVLRHPVPGLVPPRRRGRARLRPPAAAPRGRAAGRPVDPGAVGLRRGPARQARRLRRRPRRDGHLGDVVAHARRSPAAGRRTPTCSSGSSRWTCAPRPTTSSAPGCSPASSARTSRTTPRRGPTP